MFLYFDSEWTLRPGHLYKARRGTRRSHLNTTHDCLCFSSKSDLAVCKHPIEINPRQAGRTVLPSGGPNLGKKVPRLSACSRRNRPHASFPKPKSLNMDIVEITPRHLHKGVKGPRPCESLVSTNLVLWTEDPQISPTSSRSPSCKY